MTYDQIDRLLRQANPVPDLSVLEPIDVSRLPSDQPRRPVLQTDDRIENGFVGTKPHRRTVIAIAAALVVITAGALVFGSSDRLPVADGGVSPNVAQPTLQSAPEEPAGLTGFPPEGAIPSSPEAGRLVVSMWEHIGAPGSFGNGWLYVYEDGRLIWEQQDPTPTGGWLEQRLTPQGVEMIRSELLASGLFEPGWPPPEPNGGWPRHINGGTLQVRNDDQLIYINHIVPELFERLASLWSWLPESAWVDLEPRAFVAPRFAACFGGMGRSVGADMTEVLIYLPPEARELLAGASLIVMKSLSDVDPAGFDDVEESDDSCFALTIEQTRALAGTLVAAGIERSPESAVANIDTSFVIPTEAGVVHLGLWPMLPHGVPAFTGA